MIRQFRPWSIVLNVVLLSVLAVMLGLRPVAAQFSPPSRNAGVPIRWDYRSVSATQEEDPGYERFTQEIQDLGDLGYEMVTCLYAPARDRDESTTACYFKRPQSRR
jgi:hypothetical protein